MINEEYCIQISFLDCRNLFLMILAHYFAVHVHDCTFCTCKPYHHLGNFGVGNKLPTPKLPSK